MFTPRLGFILFFAGTDKRKVQAVIDNVTSFSAEAHTLKQGDSDVTATYISDSPDSAGNLLMSATIGGLATLPAGYYRYFITGTHDGKVSTWYWDILVLARDISQIEAVPTEDYRPLIGEVVMYEGDSRNLSVTIPGLDFSAVTGVFKFGDTDVTSTYCNSSASASGEVLTTHNIGGAASIPAGVYGYFISGTHSNSDAITTYYWRVTVLPKQSVI